MWPAIIAAGAAIGSSLLSNQGARDTNEANERIAREQMAWNAEQADINRIWSAGQASNQMSFQATQADLARHFNAQEAATQRDWSERMANTSYQRAIGDMRAAGLNPMLAYSQGGAPTPSGSSAAGSPSPAGAMGSSSAAHYSSLPARQNAAQVGLSSAFQALQLSNIVKQGDNIDADTALKKAAAARETASAGNLAMQTEKLIVAEIPKMRKEIDWIDKQIVNSEDRRLLDMANTALSKVEAGLKSGQIELVDAQAALSKVERLLKELQVPEAKAYADKFGTKWGQDMTPYLREILQILLLLSRR